MSNMNRQAWGGGAQEFKEGLNDVVKRVEKHKLVKLGSSYETLDSQLSSNLPHAQSHDGQTQSVSSNVNRDRVSSDMSIGDDPLLWDSEKVGEWLKELGLPSEAFLEAGVTGEDLFALGKGQTSTSGLKALNKLRPFLARRVVYEAERLMAMLDPSAPKPSSDSLLNTKPSVETPSSESPLASLNTIFDDPNLFLRSVSDSLDGSNSMVNYGSPPPINMIPQSPVQTKGVMGGFHRYETKIPSTFDSFNEQIYEPLEPMEPLHPREDSDSNSVETLCSDDDDDEEAGLSISQEDYRHSEKADAAVSTPKSALNLGSPIAWKSQSSIHFSDQTEHEKAREPKLHPHRPRSDLLKVDSFHESDHHEHQSNHNHHNHHHHHHRHHHKNQDLGDLGIHEPLEMSQPPTPMNKIGKSPRKNVQFDVVDRPSKGPISESVEQDGEYMVTTTPRHRKIKLTGLFGKLEEKKLRLELSKLDNMNFHHHSGDKHNHQHRPHNSKHHSSDNGSVSSTTPSEEDSKVKPRRQSIKMIGLTKSHPSTVDEGQSSMFSDLKRSELLKSHKENKIMIVDDNDNDTISSHSTLASSDDGESEQISKGSSVTPKRSIQMTSITKTGSSSFDSHKGSFDSKQSIDDRPREIESQSSLQPKTPKGNNTSSFLRTQNVKTNSQMQIEQEQKTKSGRKIRAPIKMVTEDKDRDINVAASPSSMLRQHHQKLKEEDEAKKKAAENAGGGRKRRGINKIVLDLSSNVEDYDEKPDVQAGNSSIVCETPMNHGRPQEKKLMPLGTKQLLIAKKDKEKETGDFNEDGLFSYGAWKIDQDGIQAMPTEEDRSDMNTARASHTKTSSGRNTPYSGRGSHRGSRASGDMEHTLAPVIGSLGSHRHISTGFSAKLNRALLPLEQDGIEEPQEPFPLSGPIESSYIRRPKLTGLHKTPTEDDSHRGSSTESSEMGSWNHKNKQQSKDQSSGSTDNIFEPMEPLTEPSPRYDLETGSDFVRGSVDTWGSISKSNPNLSLNMGGGGSGEDSFEESGDDLLRSLKFDKFKMPIGGAGGDFEKEHKGFVVQQPDEPIGIRASDFRRNRHQQQRNMDGLAHQNSSRSDSGRVRSDSVDSARSTGSGGTSTPRKTKSNLVKLEELGRGAGGVVYKAIHIPTMTVVAVKHMFVEDEAKRRQMQRELNLLHAFNSKPLLQHYDLGDVSKLSRTQEIIQLRENEKQKQMLHNEGDNEEEEEGDDGKPPGGFGAYVVSMFDAYTDKAERSVCLVLEYMSGGSLESFVKEHRRLSEEQIAHIARCCLMGLSELKKKRLLHRDIKPANILIDHLGNVKLSDFGIMKEFEVESLSKTFTGTLAYMSPERILCGSGQTTEGYSYPADIWGLGLSLLALGLGREPLPLVTTIWDVLSCQDESKYMVPSLRNHEHFAHSNTTSNVSYSADLCDMVDCCLRRDPKLRLTADELLKHPFFDKYPYQNPSGEKSMKRFSLISRLAAEELIDEDFPVEPLKPPLFGMFTTPETSATRMLVNLIKHMNSNPSSNDGSGTDRKSNSGPRKFIGLTPEILNRLRSQLPGIEENRFKSLHDRALRGLEGDERRKNLMTWANQKTR